MAGSSAPSMVLLVVAMALLVLPPPWAADALCDGGDRQILLNLKQSLGNPSALSTWREDNADCCNTWPNMECNEAGRVTLLDIQGVSNVAGTISPSVCGLTYLEEFTIRKYSNLTGPIPAEIGNLRYLAVLDFERNGLTGSIPGSIGQLRNLVFLSLSANRLSGSIPATLGNLYNLQELYLDVNQLSGGVPASLASLNPTRVNISRNKLSGDVSGLINAWTTAVSLDISVNAFSFDLSPVKFPTGFQIFLMKGNGIYGTIPTNADNMKGLQQFDVSNNKLCGSIPQGGVVNRFPAASFDGNTCLCGKPMVSCLFWNCPLLCIFTASSSSSSSVQASR